MIAKPKWFGRRKYGGWGATPKTWQGWVYIAVVIGIIFAIQAIPFLDNTIKTIILLVLLLFLGIDMANVLVKMPKDERERIHEAKAERNALWAIVAVLAIGIAYQAASSAMTGEIKVDWFVVAALVIGLAVKAISNLYLERKE